MAKLKFELDKEGNPIKNALGMYSKDGEYVDLKEPCDLNGQVSGMISYIIYVYFYWPQSKIHISYIFFVDI